MVRVRLNQPGDTLCEEHVKHSVPFATQRTGCLYYARAASATTVDAKVIAERFCEIGAVEKGGQPTRFPVLDDPGRTRGGYVLETLRLNGVGRMKADLREESCFMGNKKRQGT